MKLTNRSEYAMLAMLYLARLGENGFATGDQIAKGQEIPKRFLQQILYALKGARLVRTVKGRGGGYQLARPAAAISVAEIVRLFDGPIAASRSVSTYFYEKTPIGREKKTVAMLRELRDLVAARLEGTTLENLV